MKTNRMKKYFLLLSLIFISTACVQFSSVVDKAQRITPYTNVLVIIPYNWDTEIFSDRLKLSIEERFKVDNKKVEVILAKKEKEKLALNEFSDTEARINATIAKDNKDLILIFKPTYLGYGNGTLQKVTYMVTAKDIQTKKEVWKGEFTLHSTFGPSAYAKNIVLKIYDQLKKDQVI